MAGHEGKDSIGGSTAQRFSSQSKATENVLADQTHGLVSLDEYRKRRAAIDEEKEREAREVSINGPRSASSVNVASNTGAPSPNLKRKSAAKKKPLKRNLLSFDSEEADDADDGPPAKKAQVKETSAASGDQRRLGPNPHINNPPKLMTKAVLAKEAEAKERLRKEYVAEQEHVRNASILIPFVFSDGSNTPGGACQVKKCDPIWRFLDLARKAGAESADKSRRDWARISVDDLMFIREDIIIPHHYEFYFFIINHTKGYNGQRLFDYSDRPTEIQAPGSNALEGHDHDPSITKIVDRRWYENNKHIYPASSWEDFSPEKDYSQGVRRDRQGNSYFFS